MVKADIADKKVFISIKGNIEKRRSLLTLIRSDFERIHRDIKNLLPEEFIPIPGSPNITIPYNELIEFEKIIEPFMKSSLTETLFHLTYWIY
jgi:internalin A